MGLIYAIIESMFISIVCIGIKITFAPGKIFDSIGKLLAKWYNKGGFIAYLSMPLGHCHYCMASFYGILLHVYVYFIGLAVCIELLPAILLMSVCLNGIIFGAVNKTNPGLF